MKKNINTSKTLDKINSKIINPIEVEYEYEFSRASKSKDKKDKLLILDLATILVKLNSKQLESLNLDQKIIEAINIAKNISFSAQKRQLNFIGKQLRTFVDLEELTKKVSLLDNSSTQSKIFAKTIEDLRDQFLKNNKETIKSFINEHIDSINIQEFNSILRQARKEYDKNIEDNSLKIQQKKLYQY
ncbi:MAG: ribosome biogenesis factor YjgA, partial [Psittacicella sp.]